MRCGPPHRPSVTQPVGRKSYWQNATPGGIRGRIPTSHTAGGARALVSNLHYRLDVNTLHRDESAETLSLNEIGRVRLRTTAPLFYDEYRRNRATGSFILVDEATHATVAGGMILAPS